MLRHVADEAVGGRAVVIDLSVRRLYCENPACEKVTFAEQVEGLTRRYQRRTPALQKVVDAVAVALAGSAGARLLGVLHHVLSWATVLNCLMRITLPARPTPQVLGIDEFALRRRAKSSTPTAVGSAWTGSGRSITRRRRVLRLVMMPVCSASRAPARPARARPMVLSICRSRSVTRPCRRVRPGICSTKVRPSTRRASTQEAADLKHHLRPSSCHWQIGGKPQVGTVHTLRPAIAARTRAARGRATGLHSHRRSRRTHGHDLDPGHLREQQVPHLIDDLAHDGRISAVSPVRGAISGRSHQPAHRDQQLQGVTGSRNLRQTPLNDVTVIKDCDVPLPPKMSALKTSE